jgi:hypothetical protein
MGKRLKFSVLLFFFINCVFSQEKIYSGIIQDEFKKPIDSVKVILFKDGNLSTNAITYTNNKGEFLIASTENIALIKFEHKNFIEEEYKIENNTSGLNIILKKQLVLDEVIVTSIKKSIKNENGTLTLYINKNPYFDNLSTKEALIYLPKIEINDNNISVLGKKRVLILINNRVSSLSIDNIPAKNVKKIELISNSSSKYSANYDAVINVTLNNWETKGISGNILNKTTIIKNEISSFGTNNLKYNKNKFSTNFNYSYNLDNNVLIDNTYQELQQYNYNLFNHQNPKRRVNYLSSSSNYELNENENFGFETSITKVNSTNISNLFQEFYNKNSNVNDSILNSKGLKLADYNDADISVYYTKKKEKYDLNSYVYFQQSKTTNSKSINTFDINDNLVFDNITQEYNYTKNLIGNFDFTYNKNDSNKFDLGFRYVLYDGKYSLEINPLNTLVEYRFKESVFSQYFIWNYSLNKFNLSIGNRIEYFNRNVSYNNFLNNNSKQLDFFPSISLEYKLKEKHNLDISLSKKIDRVSFNSILPYSYYISFNEIAKGNPNLLNQINYEIELNYVYDNTLFITPYLNFNKNLIEKVTLINDNLIEYIYQNYNGHNYGISSTLSKKINSWLSINAKVNLQRNINSGIIQGINFKNDNIESSASLTNILNYKNYGSLITQSSYSTPVYYDFYKISTGFRTDLRYTKKLMNDNLVLSITVKDILKSYFNKNESINQIYYSKNDKDYGWQQFIFSMSYNFNKGRNKNKNSIINSNETQRTKI